MSFAVLQYRDATISTVSPTEIVVKLYDGAIKFLHQAMAFGAQGNIPDRSRTLGRAHAIICELQATLDHEKAPEIAGQLSSLYDFILHRISEATMKNDATLVAPAIDVLMSLRSAWAEIAKNQ